MDFSNGQPLIIDVGSDSCKVGFSDEVLPRKVLYKADTPGHRINHLDLTVPTYPFYFNEGQKVIAWDLVTPFYEHLYGDLGASFENHPVLLVEPLVVSPSTRERLASIFFEQFGIPGLSCVMDAMLSLYGANLTTGVVLDIGHRYTQVNAFCDGYSVRNSLIQLPLGGKDLTDLLQRLLTEVNFFCRTKSDEKIVRTIKETKAYIPLDYEEEMSKHTTSYLKQESNTEGSYELPDGSKIFMPNQRFRCTEPLFEPNVVGKHYLPVPEVLDSSIRSCDVIYRRQLLNNIVLAGGTTLIPGFVARIHHEIARFAPENAEIGIIANENRQFSAWIGGSIVSSCNSFQKTWTTKQEYEEYGPSIISTKRWY